MKRLLAEFALWAAWRLGYENHVATYDLGDGALLTVTLTGEGIIADVVEDGRSVATFSNMADEFAYMMGW